jgi:hypothetical protein
METFIVENRNRDNTAGGLAARIGGKFNQGGSPQLVRIAVLEGRCSHGEPQEHHQNGEAGPKAASTVYTQFVGSDRNHGNQQ